MNKTISLSLGMALALGAACAQAQQAGSVLVRVGATHIAPDLRSGNLSAPSLPNTQVDIDSATQVSGGISYAVSNNLVIDLPLALPFKHEITGAGAIAGVGKLGEVRALPVTLLAQWRFGAADAKVRPYVGAGPTYAKFYRERSTGVLSALTAGSPTTLKVDSKLAATVQAGAVFAINDRMFIDAMVAKTFLKTTAHLSTGQSIDVKLDPWAYSVGVGWRF